MLFRSVLPTGLHYLHVLFILFILTVALMLGIGRIAPMATPYHFRQTAVIDIRPWKHRHWYSAALIIAVVLMFLLFSPFGLVK